MRGDRGFTLLEVLVVLVIAGLLFFGLAQGTHVGLLAWGMQARMLNARAGLDEVDLALRRMIVQMDPGGQSVAHPLDGSASAVSFTTELPLTAGTLVTRRADVWLGLDGTHRLVLRWTPHLHAQPLGPAAAPSTTVLLEGVDRLQIAYWLPPAPGQAAGWRDAWQADSLPGLVRIRLAFSERDGRRWPPIIVAPPRERPE
ncbi:MAG: prepilin-type N-terminal cleavage/methylation domain-containing protein [Acidisphaera sp.]|nr:prepilin-type N-terminal cleavage/methylation domain-containing protein [Acidisphaera sp.]